MTYEFRWNPWNVDHIAEHGVSMAEAEYVVQNARAPYPGHVGWDKYRVRGKTAHGVYLQVVYIVDPARTVYVIHARPLSEREKKQFRRSLK